MDQQLSRGWLGRWLLSYEDLGSIVAPPNTFTVDDRERKPLLYLPDGRALVRRPAGFRTEPTDKTDKPAATKGSK